MLMLMDNAQSSMIDTLQRQLAEERERGAHRLQTETLMHQLISERNMSSARAAEEQSKWESDVTSLQRDMTSKMEKMREENGFHQRNLIMQKRANVELKKENEELERKLKYTKESTDDLLDKNRQVFEEEKKAFAHRVKTDKGLIENTKKQYEVRMKEKDAQHESLNKMMEGE